MNTLGRRIEKLRLSSSISWKLLADPTLDPNLNIQLANKLYWEILRPFEDKIRWPIDRALQYATCNL